MGVQKKDAKDADKRANRQIVKVFTRSTTCSNEQQASE